MIWIFAPLKMMFGPITPTSGLGCRLQLFDLRLKIIKRANVKLELPVSTHLTKRLAVTQSLPTTSFSLLKPRASRVRKFAITLSCRGLVSRQITGQNNVVQSDQLVLLKDHGLAHCR